MRKVVQLQIEEAHGNIVMITQDIANCFKKGVLLGRTTIFEELSFMDGWTSIYAEYKDDKIHAEYWLDDEILPAIPEERVCTLSENQLRSLTVVEMNGQKTVEYQK